jgi:hypothetical protein
MTRYVGIADWVIKITGQKLPKALQDTPVRRDLMAVIENESGDFVVHGKCVMNPETYKASDCQRKPPLKGKEASQIKAQAVYEDGLAFESCRGLIGAYELVRHANPARRDSRKIEHLKLTFDRIVRRLTGQLSVPDRSKPAMDPNQAQGYLPH